VFKEYNLINTLVDFNPKKKKKKKKKKAIFSKKEKEKL
jgi:hypothetical protein